MTDDIRELLGGTSQFRELGARYGYGNGIDVLARTWAERTVGKQAMGKWLIHFGERLVEEADGGEDDHGNG